MTYAMYCPEPDVPEFSQYFTMPCGHVHHRVCFRERLETGHLGFAVTDQGMRAEINVLGATCPALVDGKDDEHCSEPIPWLSLFNLDFFGDRNLEAKGIWEDEITKKCISEATCLQHCPGRGCDVVFLLSCPTTNVTKTLTCIKCNVGC